MGQLPRGCVQMCFLTALSGVSFLAVFSSVSDSSHLLGLFSFDSEIISPGCRPLESVLSLCLSVNWNSQLKWECYHLPNNVS